ncbi:MAG: hypothetical protein KAX05_14180 [Bacteroidales bacterium]|nr:hypothetical protein [Bacteroidales bacterium]
MQVTKKNIFQKNIFRFYSRYAIKEKSTFLPFDFIFTMIIFKIILRASLSRPKKHVFGSEGMLAGMGCQTCALWVEPFFLILGAIVPNDRRYG